MYEGWKALERDIEELEELSLLINEESNEYIELQNQTNEITKKYKEAKIQLFLSDQYDIRDAILSISTGTGGTDAKDFSGMLMRMYMRYCERKGFKVQIIEKSEGSDAGIKSVTMSIKGEMVYGYLKGESGVHRLIRLSPYNAKNLRQTSFSLVEVVPEFEKCDSIDIEMKDLRIDTFRSSGAGGQHVNVTDSAVRITHIPTGIVAQSQNQRSQLQNKDQALKILKSRLLKKEKEEEEKKSKKLKGAFKEIDFGNQIRTYTLHPYKLVKDHRTNYETSSIEKVFDGAIDDIIESGIKELI